MEQEGRSSPGTWSPTNRLSPPGRRVYEKRVVVVVVEELEEREQVFLER